MEIKVAIIGLRLEGKKNPATYFAIHKDSGKEIMGDIKSLDEIIETLKQLGYKIIK
jgi:hypothetical protein